MKYLSLIAISALLIWTWKIIHRDESVNFETHAGIQEKLALLISDTVKAKRPGATDVIVDRIWTEISGKDQVRAFFVYSYKELGESGDSVRNSIKGQSLLERQNKDDAGNDVWKLVKIQTNSSNLTFDEGLVVTPDTPTETPNAAPETTPSETPKEKSEH
jgi:hypothetical protein